MGIFFGVYLQSAFLHSSIKHHQLDLEQNCEVGEVADDERGRLKKPGTSERMKNLEHHANNESREESNGDESEPPVDDDCPTKKKRKKKKKMMIAQPPQATRIVIPLSSIPILPGNIQKIGFRGN